MGRNEKADLRGIGSNENRLTDNQRRLFNAKYNPFPRSVQCQHCGSDYMRFAIDGYCQRCQQRAEYVIREQPATAERAKARGAY